MERVFYLGRKDCVDLRSAGDLGLTQELERSCCVTRQHRGFWGFVGELGLVGWARCALRPMTNRLAAIFHVVPRWSWQCERCVFFPKPHQAQL